ncbi:MAG: 4'-phosphopantetheinyl transferase [Zhongshania sp.]|jgi:4'-phosphopantetheinyl transferase
MISPLDLRPLRAGHVDTWFCFTNDHRLNSRIELYEAMLSAAELQQYQQLKHADNARDYLVSRALLRTVLAEYCDFKPEELCFRVNDFGKPELDHAELLTSIQFNTAHTRGLTVCVVTQDNVVGVDVECRTESSGILSVADDYFSPLELQALKSRSAEQQLDYFYRYWTLKEAYIKARGEGLSVPLYDFSVLLDDDGEFKEFIGPEAERWDFSVLAQNTEYTASLAMGGKLGDFSFYNSVPLGPQYENTAANAFRHTGAASKASRRSMNG